jgi:hypothetical protein
MVRGQAKLGKGSSKIFLMVLFDRLAARGPTYEGAGLSGKNKFYSCINMLKHLLVVALAACRIGRNAGIRSRVLEAGLSKREALKYCRRGCSVDGLPRRVT